MHRFYKNQLQYVEFDRFSLEDVKSVVENYTKARFDLRYEGKS